MHFDFLIIGGGILGLSVARELKKKKPKARVGVIEKEIECGQHASGRNSGVIHAGFYYSSNSLKALFCKKGNEELQAYAKEKGIFVNPCGKLVVASHEGEIEGLFELLKRAKENGVALELISEKEAKEIEPRVKTLEKALFSPTTATVDPRAVMEAIESDAILEGIILIKGAEYLKRVEGGVFTSSGVIETDFVINAAGLYADKIAFDFGFSHEYRILPFKGLYLQSDEPAGAFQTNIYPVPDFKYPFLGVHFTVTDQKKVKIGPTAIPALWREQYKGLSRFQREEFFEILPRQVRLFFSSSFDFKKLALTEMQKYFGRKMVKLGAKMAKISAKNYKCWANAGIRAQLFNLKTQTLETDFVLQKDNTSLHILNAVSPGFTSAFPFARYIVQEILNLSK